MSVNSNRLQEDEQDKEAIDYMKHLAISKLESRKNVLPRYVHPDISRWYPSTITVPPIFIWDQVSFFSLSHLDFSVFNFCFFCQATTD
jgi:hypothetical protein